MRIQQLHYIIKIVETGSMNEAAKQLFITQPSLSNAVRDLEREMGIDIFIRNPKGITLTKDGVEFLSYARQVVEQTNLLEERYKSHTETRELFSVSSQHYAFVVNAFVSLLKRADMTRYELFLRETRTYEIIEDVKNFRSEIGVLFLNSYNRDVLTKMFDDNRLTYTSLFKARPHIFVSKSNPLAKHEVVSLEDLEDLTFEKLAEISNKAVTELGVAGFGFDSSSNAFISSLKMDGLDFVDSKGTINVDNEWVREYMTFFQKQAESGAFRIAGEDKFLSNPFVNQKMLCYQGSSAGYAYLNNDGAFEIAVVEVPVFEGKDKAVMQLSLIHISEPTRH